MDFPKKIVQNTLANSVGTAEGIRTPDLLVRSQSLYPTELQPHTAEGSHFDSLLIIAQLFSNCKSILPFFQVFFPSRHIPFL